MNRKIGVCFFICILLAITNFSAVSVAIGVEKPNSMIPKNCDYEWYIYTVDKGSYKYYSSLALDSNNYPNIIGTSQDGCYIKYAKWNGSEWEYFDKIYEAQSYPCSNSMALDSGDNPHICYYAVQYGYCYLKYAILNGTEWNITNIDYGDPGFAISNSIDIDSQNNPHIVYTTDYYTGQVKYAKFDGHEWEQEIVDDTPNSTAANVAFSLDSNNYPHIAYYDINSNDSGILRYARWNGEEWEKEIVDDSADVGAYVSLALDSLDCPHISYACRLEGSSWWYGNIKYAYKDEQNWTIEEVTTGNTVGSRTSIALDSNGNPFIAYIDGNCLEYANRINGNWESETVASGGPSGPSLVIDINNKPHMSYCGFNSGNLSYATTVENIYPPEKPSRPSGQARGKVGEEYSYTTSTIDLDGGHVKYGWDWNGDKVVDEWTGYYESGETVTTSHTWTEKGTYSIMVKAQDKGGLESDWSDPLPVTMPRTISINSLFIKLLERFPNGFPILRHLMEQ